MRLKIDISECPSPHSLGNRLGRALWELVWLCFFRTSPGVFHAWRRLLLRAFGATVGKGVHIYPSCRIWAPWNLTIGDYSGMGHHVDCYCVTEVRVGDHVAISQYSYLCGATHDYTCSNMPSISKPIRIESGSWVCADVFVGPGVTIGEGAVVGARASVFTDVAPWTIVGGNPARFIKQRALIS
jgi:putative colanic acid biosynthesis acetyltransferase WcaF